MEVFDKSSIEKTTVLNSFFILNISVMNHCICLSFHMLSLKLFEKCFPFNRVLSFLVSENLTSCRLNKYFSTACKESSVR